jgi:adenylosuccinate synthase
MLVYKKNNQQYPNSNIKADFVIGLQHGDEGKGKITHDLCREGGYTHVLRFNGGPNAGHTIYHEGQKLVTHHIPSGVFFGIRSIIGNGCVIDPERLFDEIKELEAAGIDVISNLRIAENAHIIMEEHKNEDGTDEKIGTTRRGCGPAYRSKYDRSGALVRDYRFSGKLSFLTDLVVDLYDELHTGEDTYVLCEGAQGFGIDIDWGDYPFVTSSHCTTAGALLNGIPPQAVNRVWGVAKAYETYVGAKNFQGYGRLLTELQEVGQEFGATTGRRRQTNWIDLDFLAKSCRMNGVTDLVVNKMDIMREVMKGEHWENDFKKEVSTLADACGVARVFFSDNPHTILSKEAAE